MKTVKKISGFQGLGRGREGGRNRQSTDDFQGSEGVLYDSTMVDTCLYTFVQTHRTPRVDPNVNYRLR